MAGVLMAAGQRFPSMGCACQRRRETVVVVCQAAGIGVKALTVPAFELQNHPRVGVEGGDG